MRKVTLKGLAAHKLRFVLTAVAVIIGVAFLSGTLVFTDTIQQTFDDLFADIYRTPTRSCAAPRRSRPTSADQRPHVPASTLAAGARGRRGSKAAEGHDPDRLRADRRHERRPDRQPGPGRARRSGSRWGNEPGAEPRSNIASGRPPTRDDEIVIDKRSASTGRTSHVGDTRRRAHGRPTAAVQDRRDRALRHRRQPRGRVGRALHTPRRRRRSRTPPGSSTASPSSAEPGRVAGDAEDRRLQESLALGNYEVLTGKEITKENQDLDREAARLLQASACTIFALIALVVAIFIIYNTFSIIVAQRTRELALLRAIGASGRQVLLSVLGESFVVGLLASGRRHPRRHPRVGTAQGAARRGRHRHPGGGIVVKPSTVVIGLVVGARRHDPLRDRPRAEGGAHPTDRGDCATSRSSADQGARAQRSPGWSCSAFGLALLFVGCSPTSPAGSSTSAPARCSCSPASSCSTPLFARGSRARSAHRCARSRA